MGEQRNRGRTPERRDQAEGLSTGAGTAEERKEDVATVYLVMVDEFLPLTIFSTENEARQFCGSRPDMTYCKFTVPAPGEEHMVDPVLLRRVHELLQRIDPVRDSGGCLEPACPGRMMYGLLSL